MQDMVLKQVKRQGKEQWYTPWVLFLKGKKIHASLPKTQLKNKPMKWLSYIERNGSDLEEIREKKQDFSQCACPMFKLSSRLFYDDKKKAAKPHYCDTKLNQNKRNIFYLLEIDTKSSYLNI